jgi:hypothetical protein
MIPTTFYCGHIDNCAATMKIHLSKYEFDGGPRLIIKYQGEQSYCEADDEGVFERDKKYNISIDIEELSDIIAGLSCARDYWLRNLDSHQDLTP